MTDTCPICMEDVDCEQETRRLQTCGHTFHATCVNTWLTLSATCPVCRDPVADVPEVTQEIIIHSSRSSVAYDRVCILFSILWIALSNPQLFMWSLFSPCVHTCAFTAMHSLLGGALLCDLTRSALIAGRYEDQVAYIVQASLLVTQFVAWIWLVVIEDSIQETRFEVANLQR